MTTEIAQFLEFGSLRLDTRRKVLWHNGEPVPMPLKELELLCMLVERRGELVTKDELLEMVWAGSFVEESNLSRHIYLLRKTLKELGESEELIQNVPRRGYRFAGDVRDRGSGNGDIIIERQALTRTLVEEITSTGSEGPETEDERAVTEKIEAGRRKVRAIRLPRLHFTAQALGWAVISLLVLAGGVALWRDRTTARTSPPEIKSIAVLPFRVVGAESGDEHIGLGVADVLITRLSNIRELNVRPTSAVMNFGGSDSAAAGRELKVDAVLEGTIYRAGDRVRVTARLLKASDGSPLWAGQFEKPLEEELKVQDEISLQLVDALALSLSGNEKTALTKRYTESADAYQLYLKGRYHWNKRNYEALAEAERLFRNAIEKDPNFALAYVGLVDKLAMDNPTAISAEEKIQSLNKALELDPNLAEAHASLGLVRMFQHWDWKGAKEAFEHSIELNPGYASAHQWYATLLGIQGKTDEAKGEMRRALEINPLSHNFLTDLGEAHYFAREYERAEEYCHKALEIYPDFFNAHVLLQHIYLQRGEDEKYIEASIRSNRVWQTFSDQAPKEKERFEKHFAKEREDFKKVGLRNYIAARYFRVPLSKSTHYERAWYYALFGEKEKALDNLEDAYENKQFMLAFVRADPVFDNLRAEPRFTELLKKMNLAQ